MYLFSYRRLAFHLKHNLLDESDKLIYLCVALLQGYAGCFFLLRSENPNTILLFEFILGFIFMIVGYYINKSGDNKDYIVRYIILGVPVYFQGLLIFMIFYFVLRFLDVDRYYIDIMADLLYNALLLHGIYLSSRKV
jgi:hypothetical protein